MSLEEGLHSSSLVRKRPFDVAFSGARDTIDSFLPPGLTEALASCWKWSAGVLSLFREKAQEWQASAGSREDGQPATRPRRRRVTKREPETKEQRDARRAERRRLRIPEQGPVSDSDPFTDSVKQTGHERQIRGLSSAAAADSNIDKTPRDAQSQHGSRARESSRVSRRSLRLQLTRTLESRDRLSFYSGLPSNYGASASPMHRGLVSDKVPKSSALSTRTPRDAANVLNRITPHNSRIQKMKNTKVKSSLPFTSQNLSKYLESPAQVSPHVTYRSPGAPLPSPASNFNPFKTKTGNNRYATRTDADSLEDLIAQLRKDHPHMYEWSKIDKERQQRNLEIAKKRGLLTKTVRIPLPIEVAKKVEKVLHGRSRGDDEILIEKFNQEIRVKDLTTLGSSAWLNDEVINFYMNLIIERAKAEGKLRIHAFNTFFYTKLIKGGYKDVRRWAKKAKVDIATCDLVLVPVHLGVHWCMAVINAREKRFEYWDSLKGGPGGAFSALREYMKHEAPSVDTSSWTDWIPESGPSQRNGWDCGVFACQTAECVSRSAEPDFSQGEMQELRKRMAASILDATLY